MTLNRLNKTALMIGLLGSISFISACSSDDPQNLSNLRIIHASPDAPPVNIAISSPGYSKVIENLDYADSSGYMSIASGARNIAVEAIIPGGNSTVISVDNFNFETNVNYNILAVNKTAAIEALIANESAAEPASDEVAISVIHASPDAPAVDVYVTAPGTDITTVDANFSFDFKGQVDAGALPAATYDLAVTVAGTKTVAYNISDVDLSPFAGQKLMLVAVSTTTDTTTAASPVKLLAVTDSSELVLLDEDTEIGARVVHLSPDADAAAAGPVEVFATSDMLGPNPVELIPAFSYTDVVPGSDSYVNVPAGDYVFDVAADGAGPGSLYTSGTLSLSAGEEYTVIAAGYVATTPAFDLLPTVDSNRPVATQASVKIIHGAPAAGSVDVYVTPAGSFSVADVEAGLAGDPLLPGFAFGDVTDYVAVAPGDYDVRVVAGGSVAINVQGAKLTAGGVYTAIAREPNSVGSPGNFDLVVLTN